MGSRRHVLKIMAAFSCGLRSGLSFAQAAFDDTDQLQESVNAAGRTGGTVHLTSRVYRVRSIIVPSHVKIIADKATLEAVGTGLSQPILRICGQDVTIEGDLFFNLSGRRSSAILIEKSSAISIHAHVSVNGPSYPSRDAFNGGILIQDSTDVMLSSTVVRNIHQNTDKPGLFRAVGSRFSRGLSFGNIRVDNCDIALGLFSCQQVKVANIEAHNLTDNGIYINSDCLMIDIKRAILSGVEEGIVLNCRSDHSDVSITYADIAHATNKGISMRTGGGYRIFKLLLNEATIGQSASHSGISSLRIDDLGIMKQKLGTKPLQLGASRNISIGEVHVANITDYRAMLSLSKLPISRVAIGRLRLARTVIKQ